MHSRATDGAVGAAIPENRLASSPSVDRLRKRGLPREGTTMAVAKVIELLSASEQSWEDAARQAVAGATKSVRGISSAYASEFQATVDNDKVKNFASTARVAS
jgi:dodecin